MNIQKKFYALLLTVFFAAYCNAQSPSPLHIGLKAGANFTDLTTAKELKVKSVAGYGLGLMARLDIKKAYLQADFMFSEKNVKIDNGSSTSKMKHFEVPVVVGYKLINLPLLHLRAYAGGVYTNMVNDNFSKEAAEGVFKDFDKNNLGYRVGIGADILKFTVDVSYDAGFKSISKEYKSKPNTVFVSIGYFIL